MNAVFMKSDETIDFMPDTDIESGTWVILGDIVGITKSPIRKGRLSTITTRGCFYNVPKHNSANALTIGQKIWLNPSNKKVYNASSPNYICVGYALHTQRENPCFYGFSEPPSSSRGLNGGRSNIEQEIWGLLRSLDSERMKEVLGVLGSVVEMEEMRGGVPPPVAVARRSS